VASRSRAKSQNKVTGRRYPKHRRTERREDAAREWRIDNLTWLLEFAYRALGNGYRGPGEIMFDTTRYFGIPSFYTGIPIDDTARADDTAQAYKEVLQFIRRAGPRAWSRFGTSPDHPGEIEWLQRTARLCLQATLDGTTWELPFADLVAIDPTFKIVVQPGLPSAQYVVSNLKPLFLLALATALGGREKKRLMRCAELECPAVIIKRKRKRFCRLHGSGKERQRRRREELRQKLPLAERRRIRSRYHAAAVEKASGKEAAAKVTMRRLSGNELLRDALESARRTDPSAREVVPKELRITERLRSEFDTPEGNKEKR
jgi:hypothetical protein